MPCSLTKGREVLVETGTIIHQPSLRFEHFGLWEDNRVIVHEVGAHANNGLLPTTLAYA